jgi:RNA polymerase sigma-54 factor
MKLGYGLELVQTQKLVLTPELRQAIMVLQMNVHELSQFILEETEKNPLLEVVDERREEVSADLTEDEEDWLAYFCDSSDLGLGQRTTMKASEDITPVYQRLPERDVTIREHLTSQLGLLHLSPKELSIARFIIGSIDDNGYLGCSVSEIATSTFSTESQVESMLRTVQGFDPPGVGARNLRECLELQAMSRGFGHLPLKIISNYLDDLARARYSKIAAQEQMSLKDVLRARDSILKLDPKPGAVFSRGNVTFVVPDIIVKKLDGELLVILNDNALPSIRWNSYYRRLLLKGEQEAKTYLAGQARKAYFLLKTIEQRRMTISRVMESILRRQKRFFLEGPTHLEPMILNDIAAELGIHSSTVSRAISGKYVDTPFGVFSCRVFFSPGVESGGKEVSQYNIKRTIEELVNNEDPENPLTDNQIVELLTQEGISIARRTVAKYRSQLGIPPSNRRRRL